MDFSNGEIVLVLSFILPSPSSIYVFSLYLYFCGPLKFPWHCMLLSILCSCVFLFNLFLCLITLWRWSRQNKLSFLFFCFLCSWLSPLYHISPAVIDLYGYWPLDTKCAVSTIWMDYFPFNWPIICKRYSVTRLQQSKVKNCVDNSASTASFCRYWIILFGLYVTRFWLFIFIFYIGFLNIIYRWIKFL